MVSMVCVFLIMNENFITWCTAQQRPSCSVYIPPLTHSATTLSSSFLKTMWVGAVTVEAFVMKSEERKVGLEAGKHWKSLQGNEYTLIGSVSFWLLSTLKLTVYIDNTWGIPIFSTRWEPSRLGQTPWSFGLPSAKYSDRSFALTSDGVLPHMRIHTCSFLLLIDNHWQIKLMMTD